jgi:YbbR domain-containing protein
MRPVSKEDVTLLLVSLLIALALWFNVSMQRQETVAEKEFTGIKTRDVGLANNLNSEIRPEKVNIILRGLPEELAKIMPEDIDVTIDLTGLSEGKWYVTPQGSVLGRRADIVKITPERIEVILKARSPQIQNDNKNLDSTQNNK